MRRFESRPCRRRRLSVGVELACTGSSSSASLSSVGAVRGNDGEVEEVEGDP